MEAKTCRTCGGHKPADAYRGSRKDCRECERAKHREWYLANRESQIVKMREQSKAAYQRNPERWKRNAVQWAKENPEKRNAICKENMRRQRAKLADAYVRRMLAASMGLVAAQVPQPLVDVQRELLRLKRTINEKL